MADASFDRTLDESDLERIVADWLLARYGLRMTNSRVRVTRDGIQMNVASVRAVACSKCMRDAYAEIRLRMDSKIGRRDCASCGEATLHASFLPEKADKFLVRETA